MIETEKKFASDTKICSWNLTSLEIPEYASISLMNADIADLVGLTENARTGIVSRISAGGMPDLPDFFAKKRLQT